MAHIEASSDRDNAVAKVPTIATVVSVSVANLSLEGLQDERRYPYTRDTGPPDMRPVAIVDPSASHVAIRDVAVEMREKTLKFCYYLVSKEVTIMLSWLTSSFWLEICVCSCFPDIVLCRARAIASFPLSSTSFWEFMSCFSFICRVQRRRRFVRQGEERKFLSHAQYDHGC